MHKLRQKIANDELYFIAEIGQNHQGKIEIAKKMVDSLMGLNVSAIKTVKRDLDISLTSEQKEMPYINPHSFGRTYYDHRKYLELSKDEFRDLKDYVEEKGFDFISSFTDENSLDFLVEIGVRCLKIASQRITDTRLLRRVSKTNKPVILSTGMCEIEDVDRALEILSKNEKYLLQCTSLYPCDEKFLNLNVIKMFKMRYPNSVVAYGFSGHHGGIAPDIVAYVFGARILERHYTLHRYWKGTDHSASLERDGIERILRYIEQIRKAFGSFNKHILPEEQDVLKKLRADLI